jgi:ABC-type uncharacterized transport system YnjBCD ATPase subunit
MDLTPIEYIQSIIDIDINIIRQQFGMIKLDKSCHNKKIITLSGGQKARIALVKLILMKPHFIILLLKFSIRNKERLARQAMFGFQGKVLCQREVSRL